MPPSDVTPITPNLDEIRKRIEERERELGSEGLKSGSGDGTSGGMEARVAKLEAHVEHIRSEIAKLAPMPMDLAVLRTRVDHLPTKGFIVTSAITTVAAIVGLLTLLAKMGVLATG